jgi:hypothetical protein
MNARLLPDQTYEGKDMRYVKTDDIATLNTVSAIFTFVFYGFLDFIAFIAGAAALASGIYPAALIAGGIFLLLSFLIVFRALILAGFNGQERRRQSAGAASFNYRMRLVGRPMPPLPPLALPCRLELRLRFSYAIPYYGIISLLFGIFFGAIFILPIEELSATGGDAETTLRNSLIGGIPALIVFLFGLMLLLGYFVTRQTIEVSVYGMRVQRGFSDRFIRWEDVALFAHVRTFALRATSSTLNQYELSNQVNILRFFRLYRDGSILKPTVPFAQYSQTMDLLLGYIIARTGLPLYDIRKEQPEPSTLVPRP